MPAERKVFTESFSVYMPTGTRDRLRTIAKERGVPPASVIWLAVLDKIREFERKQESESRVTMDPPSATFTNLTSRSSCTDSTALRRDNLTGAEDIETLYLSGGADDY